ncbi:MAG: hypothetical protein WCF20_08460 [Methylovirgula sp.]
MAQFSDDLKSAISELSQDIAAEMDKDSRDDRRAIAVITIDMLDLRYPEASKELNGLIADSSYEEVIAEAMEYVATCRSSD